MIALHGFLGLPSDWSLVEADGGSFGSAVQAVDLWRSPVGSFDDWVTQFLASLPASGNVLVGYSLGGRLAMHAVLRAPSRFRAVVFVSANPGLASGAERASRLVADRVWAGRFAREEWPSLMQAWGDQAVFRRSTPGLVLERREEDFSREKLSLAMERWSLGAQEDLRRGLLGLSVPSLYVTGEEDTKFTTLIREMGVRRHVVIPGAGHRVPWDQPGLFMSAMRSFLL